MASQTSPAAITNMLCEEDIEKLTKCYATLNKTYADMAQDKTPLHIRGDECVRNDALCVPQSFGFLFKSILSSNDWLSINTR
jgi:NAD-dependent dihydropyrimidine dehydrogenase PreA subunit